MSNYKIHLRADSANGVHTRVTVFINGCNCGQLTFNEKEASIFHEIILNSNWRIEGDEASSSGKWFLKRKETQNA